MAAEAEPDVPPPGNWYSPFSDLFRGLLVLAKHAVFLLVLLGFFRLIEIAIKLIFGKEGLIFFGILDVKYIFQTADLFMLVGFLIHGTVEFLKAFKKGN